MEEPVVLIVKAPNQQIDDQTIHCEVSWTVKRLKGHLSEVYPSKPRLEDQKLIYSGQLLTDNVALKDVLRTYEGQENHTLHLVCSPSKESLRASASGKKPKPNPVPMNPPLPNPPPTEGLRQRTGGASVPPPYAQPPHPSYDASHAAQQMAWMQQAYAHYMAQYMQLMATGQMPMGMQMPGGVMPPAPAPPGGGHRHPYNPGAPPLQQEAPAPVDADAPQPNVEGEEEGRVGRDWLDWVYVVSRMMVLFSIVYFYSSPFRFFIVSTLGIIMYLYQMGFFRAVQRLDQPDEAPATPAPPPTPTLDNNNTPDIPPAPPAPPTPPSPLALTWAAFSSFFLSLIPEQPNII